MIQRKYILLLIFCFAIFKINYGQCIEDCKYLQALTYLNSNEAFNNQIKNLLDISASKKQKKVLNLDVTPWIEFIEIRQFKDSIFSDSAGIEVKMLMDEKVFYQKYNFETYKSLLIEKIAPKHDDYNLHLTFSKPTGNILLAEILNADNLPHRIRRIGKGVKILFLFDKAGIINRAMVVKVFYN